jgi:hypothetical protein
VDITYTDTKFWLGLIRLVEFVSVGKIAFGNNIANQSIGTSELKIIITIVIIIIFVCKKEYFFVSNLFKDSNIIGKIIPRNNVPKILVLKNKLRIVNAMYKTDKFLPMVYFCSVAKCLIPHLL